MTFDKLKVPIRFRPRWWARAGWWVAGVAVLGGAGGFWWWQAQEVTREQRRGRAEEIVRLANEAERLRGEAHGEAANTGEQRMRRTEALLRTERALAELEPGGLHARLPEIRRLEAELDRLLARAKLELSRTRETEWTERVSAGDNGGAERALREAWELQREVNRVAPDTMRNRERELRLEREFVRFVAEPLKARSDRAAAQADAALAAQRWDEAQALLREARNGQERLNRDFPRTRFSDIALLARLDAELATLQADGLDTQVAAALAAGREQAAAGREREAAEAFAVAARAQRELNERFSRSRFVSMERLEEIEIERHTVEAAATWREAARLDGQARRHLGRRQVFLAQESLRTAADLLARAAAQWPKARGTDEGLRLRVNFLHSRAADCASIQDRFYDQLQPLPGRPEVALLRGLVRQDDFVAVMSQNPSRRTGGDFPVDSINAGEALAFAERLSWFLGRPVRLPRAEELRAAFTGASGDFTVPAAGWQEWLGEADAQGAQVWRQGTEAGVITAPPATRARDRGLRVVVEVDLAHPEQD